MKKRKLIFLDIDGTLVTALSAPTPRVREAIIQTRAAGHMVFLCTGRNMPIIGPDILEIGFDGVIASAGAHVEVGGEVLYDHVLPEALVQECLTVFHEAGAYCRIETPEGIYTDVEMEELVRSAVPDPRNSELLRMQKEMESNLAIQRYERYPRQGAYKLCFTTMEPEAVDAARMRLGDRFEFVVHNFRWGGGCINGEIIPRGVDKGKGMELVCQRCGAMLEDTVAFGDSMNDAAMLQKAGVGIAMGNACEELKALANRVCEDVEDDGVGRELERMLKEDAN